MNQKTFATTMLCSVLASNALATVAAAAPPGGDASAGADAGNEPLARWAFLLFLLTALGIGIITVLFAMWRVRVAKSKERDNAPSVGASRTTSVDPWFESGQRATAEDYDSPDSPPDSPDSPKSRDGDSPA